MASIAVSSASIEMFVLPAYQPKGMEAKKTSSSSEVEPKFKAQTVGMLSERLNASREKATVATVDSLFTSAETLARLNSVTTKAKRLNPYRVHPRYNGEISTKCGTKPQYVLIRDIAEKILFSQTNVSDFCRDKENRKVTFPIDYLADSMFIEFRKKGTLDVVDMGHGFFTSLDNRRLLVAKKIGAVDSTYGIWVRVHRAEDRLSPSLRKRFLGAKTWEEAVHRRLGIEGMGYLGSPTIMVQGQAIASQKLSLSVGIDLSALTPKDRQAIDKSKTQEEIVQI